MKGQALITLIFYVLIILTVTTASVLLIAISTISTTKYQESSIAYTVAEAGLENALIRLLRDPSYTGEANLPVGEGTATTVVTQGNPITIVSTGKLSNFVRKIQVNVVKVNGFYTFTSWNEIP